MSAATSPRPGAENTDVQPFGTRLQVQRPRPRRSDERLLALLGEHQVLTTSQLVRLTGVPERTAQHRLGTLCRAGLVSRYRPRAVVGTCPYHWWLTPFGATAIGAKPPEPWSDRLACVRTVAALSDLWLGIEDHGLAAGLSLTGRWRLPEASPSGTRTLVPTGGLRLTPNSASGSTGRWTCRRSSSRGSIESRGRVLCRCWLAGPPPWLLQHPQDRDSRQPRRWC